MAEEAQPAAIALVRACADPADEVREAAVAALESLGPPPGSAVDELVALLEDTNPDVGYWAATLLGRLGAEAVGAVEALAATVQIGRELAVRQRAAWALGQIGPGAAAAVSILTGAAAEPDPRLARLARDAIQQIQAPS